ncbi:hypothetical protein [Nonomuraea rubra]|uniref:hypothetical protein n=1 Tax=Nonomuraea rubra TaxID=46180 RepID=UPI0031E7EFDE
MPSPREPSRSTCPSSPCSAATAEEWWRAGSSQIVSSAVRRRFGLAIRKGGSLSRRHPQGLHEF